MFCRPVPKVIVTTVVTSKEDKGMIATTVVMSKNDVGIMNVTTAAGVCIGLMSTRNEFIFRRRSSMSRLHHRA